MQKFFHFVASTVLWRTMLVMLVFSGTASAQTLQDFGYQCLQVNGQQNLGTRPLLLIVANFAGETNTAGFTNSDGTLTAAPLPQDAAYYDNLVFNQNNNPSVNGYFAAMSNGRFTWTRAGVVSLNLPQSQWDSTWPGPVVIPDMTSLICQISFIRRWHRGNSTSKLSTPTATVTLPRTSWG